VAGDPEAARVGDPLTIADQQIGAHAQLAERGQHRRDLAERQEAGNVWKGRGTPRDRVVQRLERRVGQHDDRRAGQHGALVAARVALVAGVDARDRADRAEVVARDNLAAQALLQRLGLLESGGPIFHRSSDREVR